MEPQLTVYSTDWCPFSQLLLADLREAQVSFREIDVDADTEAAHLVEQLNGGNRTVPTVVFPDGRSLTNPPVSAVLARLG